MGFAAQAMKVTFITVIAGASEAIQRQEERLDCFAWPLGSQ
jgi:hypothetical protein